MARTRSIIWIGIGMATVLASCGGPQEIGDNERETDTLRTTPHTEILSIGGRLFSVPSPAQAALAMRSSGLQYNKDLLTPLGAADTTTGKVKEAPLLGMLGADLSYSIVHQDGQRALTTFQAIERLGGRLELTNAFDRQLMDHFRNNINNEDSLLRSSGKAFEAADRYLKNNDREDVSTLILTGGWIQSMHLILADPAATQDGTLMNRIGDQKATLDALIALLTDTDQEQPTAPILRGMQDLRTEFDQVERTYIYESPVTDPARRTTFINSRSSVEVPAERIQAIRSKVANVRNIILS